MPQIGVWLDGEYNDKLIDLQKSKETKQDAATRLLKQAIDSESKKK